MFDKKGVLKNFRKSTGKHLYQRLLFNKAAGLRPATLSKNWLWHSFFLVNFAKFLRASFLWNTSRAACPNRGYLHCAILKALHGFQEKRALKSRDMQFFLQNVLNKIFKIFKKFENNMKFNRVACWIKSTVSNRRYKYHTHILILSLLLVIIMV